VPALATTSTAAFQREEGEFRLVRAIHRHGLERAQKWLDVSFEGLLQSAAAPLTDLSRPSVSLIAKKLRERGVLATDNEGLALAPTRAPLSAGIDIGFSQVRIAVSDIHGQLLRAPSEWAVRLGQDVDATLDWIVDTLRELRESAERAGAENTEMLGVTISIPGPVDPETGKVKNSWKSGGDWRFLSPSEELTERLGWDCPITVSRDANASAVAESLWGAGRGIEDLLYVKWSEDGVSASMMLGHRIFLGADGVAGEIGHAIVNPRANDTGCLKEWLEKQCPRCNRQGCLSTVASLESLRRYVKDPALSAEDLLRLARGGGATNGDEKAHLARHGLKTAAQCVGRVLAPVIDMLNPEVVILGGKIGAGAYATIAPEINKSIKESDVTPAIEAVKTVSGTAALTGQTSVRGAIALTLIQAEDLLLGA
jgi:predicted NBD/HSP70 family sugar kinase